MLVDAGRLRAVPMRGGTFASPRSFRLLLVAPMIDLQGDFGSLMPIGCAAVGLGMIDDKG